MARTEPIAPPRGQPPMPKSRIPALGRAAGGAAVLLLAACSTAKPAPRVPMVVLPAAPAAPAPAPVPGARPPPAAAPAPVPAAPQPPLVTPPAAAGVATRQVMLVESVPAGAVIVVDGRPVGRAPVRLDVPVTAQGFFRDDLEVRARFVARDETEVSRTASEEFNPRERVPAVLRFTPDGVQRTMAGRPPEVMGAADPAAGSR